MPWELDPDFPPNHRILYRKQHSVHRRLNQFVSNVPSSWFWMLAGGCLLWFYLSVTRSINTIILSLSFLQKLPLLVSIGVSFFFSIGITFLLLYLLWQCTRLPRNASGARNILRHGIRSRLRIVLCGMFLVSLGLDFLAFVTRIHFAQQASMERFFQYNTANSIITTIIAYAVPIVILSSFYLLKQSTHTSASMSE